MSASTDVATIEQGRPSARAASARRRGGNLRASQVLSARNMLILSTVALVAYGVIMTYSVLSMDASAPLDATFGDQVNAVLSPLLSEAVYLLLGMLAAIVISQLKPDLLLSPRVLTAAWIVMAAVLLITAIAGSSANGATRWLYIGGRSVQPSELAKILVVLLAARTMEAYDRGVFNRTGANRSYASMISLVISVGSIVTIFALVFLEHDMGTLIIMALSIYAMLLIGGVSKRILIALAATGAVVGVVLIMIESYRQGRVAAWLGDVFDDPDLASGDGYQLKHALYALANGGFWGTGIGGSRLKYGYLTQDESDFIYAILGEEMGLLRGTLPVLLSFMLFGWAGFRIARDAATKTEGLVAVGITTSLLSQALINIGGVVKLIPETGRTLPFVSSGGSSMIACLLMVGILLAIDKHARSAAINEDPAQRRRESFDVIEGGLSRSTGTMAYSESSQRRTAGSRGYAARPRQTGADYAQASRARTRERGDTTSRGRRHQ